MFADRATIIIKSGKGGDGHVSFRREKYVPDGGPDGGDGGRGGDIVFVVDDGLNTLTDYRHRRKFAAQPGEEGGKRNCHGKNGEDLILKVPAGTVIKDAESGKVIADMSGDNRRQVILKGGRGGLGNQHFATSTMQAPKYAQPGGDAIELEVKLELKVIADVGLVGFPNVGKSTLINALIGTQIAIASSRPETTRKAIRGILTTDNAQIVLVDTPGIHRPRTLLGQRLNDVVDESLSDVDAIAFLLPADQEIGPGDKRILSRLRSDFAVKRDDGTFKWKVPLIAIVTKIDELDRSALIDKLIEINEFADFTDIVPVSALEHDNLAEVRNVLVENMPEGPQMYPAEQITEERPEDTIAELIRGAFLEELDDELPHSLAVVVDSIEYPEDNDSGESYAGKAQVIVSIYVERDSQKPIIIGHNAEHLVRVKKKLRTAVNRIVGQKAKLDLHVKVAKGWQSDPKQLEKLGF